MQFYTRLVSYMYQSGLMASIDYIEPVLYSEHAKIAVEAGLM